MGGNNNKTGTHHAITTGVVHDWNNRNKPIGNWARRIHGKLFLIWVPVCNTKDIAHGIAVHNPCTGVFTNESKFVTLEKHDDLWHLQITGMEIGTGTWNNGGIDFHANHGAFGEATFRCEWKLVTVAKTADQMANVEKAEATSKLPMAEDDPALPGPLASTSVSSSDAAPARAGTCQAVCIRYHRT